MSQTADLPPLSDTTRAIRAQLVALGARYHRAGWLLGTSGNLSGRVATASGERVVVTASGRDKGHLGLEDFVELDLDGALVAAGDGRLRADPVAPSGPERCRPSAEASIHLALYRTRSTARVALHVHTVASTLAVADDAFPGPATPRLTFTGLELVKGWDLWEEGAVAHLPVFPNRPEVPAIAAEIEAFYRARPDERVPALLIASHGITAWGGDAFSANRHLEVTEFLCQVALARRR